MLISEVIRRVKGHCCGIDAFTGKPIDAETTRDQVTYGSVDQECTGIVTCIWPTVDVIRAAAERGANLIITHEALFWNHGDRRDVLAGNATFGAKRALLDDWGGAVWRCHDYIHAGVPLETDGSMVDGIFYGFAWKLSWLDCRVGNRAQCMDYEIPTARAEDLASYLVERLGLNGTRLIGDPDATVRRVRVPMHVMGGPGDTETLNAMDAEDIDCLLAMEFIDFTTCEYVRDAAQLGRRKCTIAIGHFNLEEPGMEYMAQWLPAALGPEAADVPVSFVPMGDTYRYVVRSAGQNV